MTRTRLNQIIIGYLAACAGTVLVCMIPALPLVPFMFSGWSGPFFPLILIGGVAILALVPSVIAIRYAERNRIRSRKAHLGVGALIGIVICLVLVLVQTFYLGFWGGQSWEQRGGVVLAALIGAIPGAIGGLIYRATAGREAGGAGN